MRCSDCNTPLKNVPHENLAIDVCQKCDGVWFEDGELLPYLQMMLQKHEDIPHSRIDLEKEVIRVQSGGRVGRSCPVCVEPMRPFNYAYDSNIILDRCSICGGVWADKGEIVQLAVYVKGNPKLTKMGASMADHTRQVQKMRGMADEMETITAGALWGGFQFLPLGDELKRKTFPFITLVIITVNVLVMAFQLLVVGEAREFYYMFGTVPAQIVSGEGFHTIFSSMFLHGGLVHLFGNMLFLWIFGDNVEDAFGHIKYLLFYLLCGVAGDAAHIAMNLDSTVPCIGASGAISGIMGAYFILYPKAWIKTLIFFRVVSIPAALYLFIWIGFQVLYGSVYTALEIHGGTAWFAHIGGFFAGVVIAGVYRAVFKREAK